MNASVEQQALHVGRAISARRSALKRLAGLPPSDRRAETQALLIEAGRALIVEQGIAGTSVGDICGRAGFSRGAFYSNFTDMDHFVERLAHEQWQLVIGAVDDSLSRFLSTGAIPETLNEKNATELARSFLEIMPLSREFHLLQTEVNSYLARAPQGRTEIRAEYLAFKRHLGEALATALESAGRCCILDAEDTAEVFLACAERSMSIALANEEDVVTGYIARVTPTLILQLTTVV